MTEGGRLYRTEGVILKRSDFGEADRLLTIYTPDRGKLRVIAKGVRKTTSRKSGHVELFVRSRLLLARGRNMDIVTQAEMVQPFLGLRDDLVRVSYACYAGELLDAFTTEAEENQPLYDLLLDVLGWIEQETDLDRAMRCYELRLLNLAGFRPQLFTCASCRQDIEPLPSNYYSSEAGGVLCPRCGANLAGAAPISLNALKVLRYFQTRDYEICRQVSISQAAHREVERILYQHIVYHLEKQLKSTDFLQLLRRQAWHLQQESG